MSETLPITVEESPVDPVTIKEEEATPTFQTAVNAKPPSNPEPVEENTTTDEQQPVEKIQNNSNSRGVSPSISTQDLLSKKEPSTTVKKKRRRKKKGNKSKLKVKPRYLEMSAKEKAFRSRKVVKHRLVGLLDGESKQYCMCVMVCSNWLIRN
jgi:ABC-type lipoprotein release transport system permease subunit